MVLITFVEIIKLAITSLALGIIFMGLFSRKPKNVYDMMHKKRFKWEDLRFAIIIAAPAVVLHELAHKFVAMGFGYTASFEIFYWGLGIGLLLRLFNSPFLIIAPGYVTIGQAALSNPLAYKLIAFAGPLINLVLWFVAFIIIKTKREELSHGALSFWLMTRNINLMLFIFNMIPFGPFDGAKVFFGP
ncbi:M50 family metallopeptidase [Candidatus Woesearchaeota archaeon]|jgi:Zn-dependent protease|nr:M50 family metallopeptidase [Candidatus Woesearchaeota archaeon]MBT4322248.1 M50 family metallopeptidase [Candidatus Woesearchaeota archaeon]MBT4631268.1 M50 family metallopeptidase [Candidatus Woesearchaeota archaeon]